MGSVQQKVIARFAAALNADAISSASGRGPALLSMEANGGFGSEPPRSGVRMGRSAFGASLPLRSVPANVP
jgi:hypothetical protein